MKKLAALVLVASGIGIGAGAGCSSTHDSPPPSTEARDDVAFELSPRVSVVSVDQAEAAVVDADKISFPAAGADSLLARAPGDILVGDRNSYGAPANRYGFARKVASVARDGDRIVVTTSGEARLDEIFNHLSLEQSFTPDQLFELPDGDGSPFSPHTQNLHLAGKGKVVLGKDFAPIPVLKLSRSLERKVKGQKVKLALDVAASLSQAKFVLTPAIDFGLDLTGGTLPTHLQQFHLKLAGTLDIGLVLDADVKFGAGTTFAELSDEQKEGLSDTIESFLASSGWPTKFAPNMVDLELVGPPIGPVPTTISFSVGLSCSLNLSGGIKIRVGGTASGRFGGGLAYTDTAGWAPTGSLDVTTKLVGPSFTEATGGLTIQCGLKPKITLKLAGVVGPYLAIEGGMKGDLAYKEKCPSPYPSGLPQGSLSLGVSLYAKASVGGELSVFGFPIGEAGGTFAKGEYPLGRPLTWDLMDKWVIGRCPAQDAGLRDSGPDATLDAAPDGAPDTGAACAALQQPCDATRTCCEQLGICNVPVGQTQALCCHPDGTICGSDQQCCSGNCPPAAGYCFTKAGGACTPTEVGSLCEGGTQCKPGQSPTGYTCQ